jgi:EAL domain-containing protein (putative c-di-GMP-specific phosphodiesterase class I)
MVSPAVFIPMAEQISVMSVLGSWIIRKACADAMTWIPNKDGTLPSVSINVSPTQFLDAKILHGTVSSAILETGIDPSRVKLEITESAEFSATLLEDLHRLRELGCVISLDDFGTGYSSIAQLVDLPIDYVKVDRSLVTDIEAEDSEVRRKGMIIAKSVLQLAESLELTPIVEGIETETGVLLIQALGADLIQGYVYSRPLPQSEVIGFMGNRQ